MDSGRLETVPNGAVHLDTVRALHQTVVSLRNALEVSKNELKALKEKYEEHSRCTEYADVIEKLTIENHILRRKIIDSGYEDKSPRSQNIRLEVTYSPHSQNAEEHSGKEVEIRTATTNVNTDLESVEADIHLEAQGDELSNFCSTDNLNNIVEEQLEHPEVESPEVQVSADVISPNDTHHTQVEEAESQITTCPKETERTQTSQGNKPSFRTKLELLSKFDVRIKVRSVKEGSILSTTTSDSESTEDSKTFGKERENTHKFSFEERREHFENTEDPKGNKINLRSVSSENIEMAVPNEADAKTKVDKFDVQVRITSEENLVVKENVERSRRKDTLNLDVDDLSLRSMSEGDNSVFSEGGVTPLEPSAGGDDKLDLETASGNESEEVDDIELIFTTDESKDMSNLQEDLVSIRETDQWAPGSASTTHSTPVLIKFHTLDPDFQPGGETSENADNENQENSSHPNVISESSLRVKRVSLPSDKEIRHVAFNGKGSLDLPGRGILKSCDNKSDNMLYKKSPNTSTRRLDSVDSLTCEYNRGLSFDNTKSSSFELSSSMDILHRDESVDSFQRTNNLGHRFSVFAETDISKCGISEDDLASNLNVRRNTCPNPFQYRPPPYRGVGRGAMRVGGTGAYAAAGRPRAVLRDSYAVRRESSAQTDVSALPPRWSSDGYLAHKMPVPCTVGPTLPQRAAARDPRPAPRDLRPAPPPRRSDETRRVLLSDIGFTSMVPELSRSADPVWALGKRVPQIESPTSNSTSKFLSRGSSYRSPCLSIDRSNDWIPQPLYVPSARAEYRPWRSSMPDVRRDDTDDLLAEAEHYLRSSIDNLRSTSLDLDGTYVSTSAGIGGSSVGAGSTVGVGSVPGGGLMTGQPYIPSEPRQLRLGHTVKLITPQGRVVVGRVRYVGVAGGRSAGAGGGSVVVGAETARGASAAHNDGTHRGRRYFLANPHCTAIFVPFSKVVMAWAN